MKSRVFISKNASECPELQTFLASENIALQAHSFLRYEPLAFELPKTFDVLFFGSPRAVLFFKAQHDIPSGSQIACVGDKTAEILESIGQKPSFIGTGSIEQIAEDFKQWCGDKHVLFPQSTISLGTISDQIPESQKTRVSVYQTEIIPFDIATASTYIFTSPSNLDGFLKANTLPDAANIVAWGNSTANAIRVKGYSVDHVLEAPSISALVAYLKSTPSF